ncbi:MAG: hypothetical protein MI919_02855 [Holophagales bacterium]|nr:hypothetical protein [Holophagales bacterium]
MNIAFVSNLWPPTVFGAYAILASQVAETLRGQGHRVRVLTSDFVSDAPKDVAPLLALTTPFPRQNENVGAVDFSLRRQAAVARFNQRVTREWLEEQPAGFEDGRGADVVFCWCLNRLSLGPVRAAQALRIPVCQTINDFHPRQFRAAEPFSGVRELVRFLADIQAGRFTRDWMLENKVGQTSLKAMRAKADAHPCEETGARLRAMMPWIKEKALVDKARN